MKNRTLGGLNYAQTFTYALIFTSTSTNCTHINEYVITSFIISMRAAQIYNPFVHPVVTNAIYSMFAV